jgi:hypothetical protein
MLDTRYHWLLALALVLVLVLVLVLELVLVVVVVVLGLDRVVLVRLGRSRQQHGVLSISYRRLLLRLLLVVALLLLVEAPLCQHRSDLIMLSQLHHTRPNMCHQARKVEEQQGHGQEQDRHHGHLLQLRLQWLLLPQMAGQNRPFTWSLP